MKTLNTLALTAVTAFAITACSTTECLQQEEKAVFRATIAKGACFGTCPVYTATIKGDATLEFNGSAYVEPLGMRTGSVDPKEFCELITAIGRSDFFNQKDSMAAVADLPTTTITIYYHGKEHSVRWNSSVPDDLAGLHNALIRATYDNKTLAGSKRME